MSACTRECVRASVCQCVCMRARARSLVFKSVCLCVSMCVPGRVR